MINYASGDLFTSGCDAIVNAVNCVGVMGAGLARQFRDRYPENYNAYRAMCRKNQLRPGQLFVFQENGTTIVNFPTKLHWRDPSRIEYIKSGAKALHDFLETHPEQIQSIAVPKLGCGLGGLNWPEVREILLQNLRNLPQRRILIFGES